MVAVVLERATALAQEVSELIDEPLDHELADRVGASVAPLAADLAAVVSDRPRVS